MIYLLRIESLERDPVETGGVVAPPPGVVARLSADDELALAKPWVELEILWKTNTVKLFYQHLTELKINAKFFGYIPVELQDSVNWVQMYKYMLGIYCLLCLAIHFTNLLVEFKPILLPTEDQQMAPSVFNNRT